VNSVIRNFSSRGLLENQFNIWMQAFLEVFDQHHTPKAQLWSCIGPLRFAALSSRHPINT